MFISAFIKQMLGGTVDRANIFQIDRDETEILGGVGAVVLSACVGRSFLQWIGGVVSGIEPLKTCE